METPDQLTAPNRAALQHQITRLRQALATAGVGCWEHDLRSNQITWDDRCCELYGAGPAGTRPFADVLQRIHPEDRPTIEAIVAALQQGEGSKANSDLQFRTLAAPDGRWRWLQSRAQAAFDDTGKAISLCGTTQDITEIMVSRFSAGRSAELADIAVQGAGAGTFSISLTNNQIDYSPAFKKMLTGSAEGRMDREDFIRHIHPDDRALREAAYEEALRTGQLRYEARSLWADGTIRWVRITGTYSKDLAGNFTVFSGISQDITESKAASNALEKSELFSRSVIENSPVAKLITTGPDLQVLVVNERMTELLGGEASLIGRPLLEAVPDFARSSLPQLLRHVLNSGEAVQEEEEHFEGLSAGKLQHGYYNHSHRPLRDEQGSVYGVISTWIDVTRQVEARLAATAAQTLLNAAIETAQLGTWEFDPAQGFMRLSPRILAWMGFGPDEEPRQRDILDTLADASAFSESIRLALEPGSSGYLDVEYSIVHRSTGERRHIRTRGQLFEGDNGRRIVVGTSQDITLERNIELSLEREVRERTEALAATNEELTEANERLLHSNEELAQYAYVASHDLQEPLRKIRMFSDMLAQREDLSPPSRSLVDKIGQSSGRMTMLIRDLLEFSRLLKTDTICRPVDLNQILTDIISDFELSIREKEAVISTGRLPVIEAVSLQMNQLFYNLLSNALKFAKPGIPPVIEVSSTALSPEEAAALIRKPLPGATYFRISFSDNGIGFEKQYAEQIFEVFKRLHGRESYPGSGIGLALCRRIVANHGGALTTDSKPGAGATFHLLLPDRQGG